MLQAPADTEFLVGLEGGGPDEGLLLLEEVFHLEDQLGPEAYAAATSRDVPRLKGWSLCRSTSTITGATGSPR
jgi:hypothetical protein